MAGAPHASARAVSFEVNVRRRLGEREIALAFESDARVVAVVGPSGVGKTSVLNMVAGLLRPDAGRIAVGRGLLFGDGVDVPAPDRRAGYVFQDRRLFPHMSVRANLLYGAAGSGRLDEVADLLELTPLLARWPRHLSGGEAQRVAIGRALLAEPAFLLLDEPLAYLDRARADEVMRAIVRARDAAGVPILYVTHSDDEVAALGAARIAMG